MTLAQIIDGKLDLADILFLIAAIVFGVAAVIRFQARALDSALVATALCLVSIAWLVL